MALTAAEQYLLELMNRARLDPAGEAARMGISLNDALPAGTISAAAKQVLAPNALLEAAATKHSLWMLAADVFSHTGQNGSAFDARISAEGYVWSTAGENIAFVGSTGPVTIQGSIDQLNKNLFLSHGHRENLMTDAFREVGLGAEAGVFRSNNTNYNAAMLTEDFATGGSAHFLTGVSYSDSNHNRFYGMGEGQAGVVFTAGTSTTTAEAGGYALAVGSGAAVAVTGHAGAADFALTVDMRPGNVKLDLVDGKVFYTSGSVVLGFGINNVALLGVGDLAATGNGARNVMTGNSGANTLEGLGGRDVIKAGGGRDVVAGGSGNDVLTGGRGADAFVFKAGDGVDHVRDFSVAAHDHLRLDHDLWAGQTLTAAQVVSSFASVQAGGVVFDFGATEVHLDGLTSTSGLAGLINIL